VSPEKVRYTNHIRTRYRKWTSSATQLQPSKSLCYVRYTSTWLDVRRCVLMQEATTFNIFYDGISFQHLATVLISVFTLCYGTGLLFCDPFCISVVRVTTTNELSSWHQNIRETLAQIFWANLNAMKRMLKEDISLNFVPVKCKKLLTEKLLTRIFIKYNCDYLYVIFLILFFAEISPFYGE